MIQKLRLTERLTTMNELVRANRNHWSKGGKLKKDETELIYYLAKEQGLKPFKFPVRIKCFWHYNRDNQDPDNLRTQIKSILDGLVLAGVLQGDSMKWIKGFDGDEFIKSKDEGSEIHMYEVGDLLNTTAA